MFWPPPSEPSLPEIDPDFERYAQRVFWWGLAVAALAVYALAFGW